MIAGCPYRKPRPIRVAGVYADPRREVVTLESRLCLKPETPMSLLTFLRVVIRAVLGDRAGLAAENLALRQQLAILRRTSKRPRLRRRDRVFWYWLHRPIRGGMIEPGTG